MRKLLTLAIFLLALGANNAFAQTYVTDNPMLDVTCWIVPPTPSAEWNAVISNTNYFKPYVDFKDAAQNGDTKEYNKLFDDAVWWLDHHDHNFQSYTRNDDNPTAVARLMRIVRRAVKLDRPTARLLTERLLEYINHTPPHRTADEWSYLFSFNYTTYHCGYAPTPILVKGREVSDVLREVLGEERFDTLRKHYWKTFSRNTCALDIVTRWWQADGKISLNRYVIMNPRISKITTFLHELGKL
jgi:hypothetical protein